MTPKVFLKFSRFTGNCTQSLNSFNRIFEKSDTNAVTDNQTDEQKMNKKDLENNDDEYDNDYDGEY